MTKFKTVCLVLFALCVVEFGCETRPTTTVPQPFREQTEYEYVLAVVVDKSGSFTNEMARAYNFLLRLTGFPNRRNRDVRLAGDDFGQTDQVADQRLAGNGKARRRTAFAVLRNLVTDKIERVGAVGFHHVEKRLDTADLLETQSMR